MAIPDAGRRGSPGFAEPRFEWRRLLAELVGTFFLVLAAAGADVMNAVSGGQAGRAAAVTAPGIMVLALSYDPVLRTAGDNPFLLDSPRPRIPLAEYTSRELRYWPLKNTDSAEAERLMVLAEHEVQQCWASYEEMATGGASRFPIDARCQTSQGSGSLSHEFNGRSGQA